MEICLRNLFKHFVFDLVRFDIEVFRQNNYNMFKIHLHRNSDVVKSIYIYNVREQRGSTNLLFMKNLFLNSFWKKFCKKIP